LFRTSRLRQILPSSFVIPVALHVKSSAIHKCMHTHRYTQHLNFISNKIAPRVRVAAGQLLIPHNFDNRRIHDINANISILGGNLSSFKRLRLKTTHRHTPWYSYKEVSRRNDAVYDQ